MNKTSPNAQDVSLEKNVIPLKIELFNEELALHPDQRSLLGISDVFRTFNIHNDAYYVDSNNLEEAPLPFLAHTILHNNEFVVVEAVTATGIVITNDLLDKKRLTREEFKKIYRGSVLVFEDNEPVQAGGINLIMPSAQNIAYGLCALIITGLILSHWQLYFF